MLKPQVSSSEGRRFLRDRTKTKSSTAFSVPAVKINPNNVSAVSFLEGRITPYKVISNNREPYGQLSTYALCDALTVLRSTAGVRYISQSASHSRADNCHYFSRKTI